MYKHTIFILLCTGVILSLCGFFPPSASSQEQNTIQVQRDRAQVEFPDRITFELLANAPSPTDSVELEYWIEKTSCGQASGRIMPEITSENGLHEIEATWAWELDRSGSLPPGARIWWRWHIVTEDGKAHATEPRLVTFDDDRFDWQTLSEGQITLYWYEGDVAFGREMLQIAVEAQARLTADPDANLEKPVYFYFYADTDDLKSALQFPQQWVGGIAFTEFYTVLIAAGPENRDYGQSTVAHELMHLVVHQLAFNCWSDLPRWLDEGLACWAEGDLDQAQRQALEEAIAENTLLSLQGLSGSFSAHSDRAHLSYAQSQSVVVFLIDTYGRDKILELLGVFRDGATYDGALEQVYGFDTDELEDLWRASVGVQPRPTAAASAGTPSPVPTLALWSAAPTAPVDTTATVTAIAVPSPSPSPQPSATHTPEPTEAVAALSPATTASSTSSAGFAPIAAPAERSRAGEWTGYLLAGGGVLLGLVILALAYVRRR